MCTILFTEDIKMSNWYWRTRYAPSEEPIAALLARKEYELQRWLESPLISRWLANEAAGATAAAEIRLTAAIASVRASSIAMAAVDLATTAGLPLQIWIQVFVTLGAPYREAQILVRNENFVSGFTQGFVTGLLKWSWAQTRSRFVRFSPDFNTSGAVDLGFISANARNEGVRNGHLHASLLSDATKKKILSHLRSLSPTTHAGNWDRNAQISYVIELAAAGRRTNLFK